MAFSHGTPNSIVTDGLVFCVDAANTLSYISGSSKVYDLIDTNVTGSIINDVRPIGNPYNWEFGFDGVDDEIVTNTNFSCFNNTTYWSVNVWFKAHTITTYDTLFGNGYPLQVYLFSNRIKLWLSKNNSTNYFTPTAGMTSNTEISLDTYYNFTLVRDNTSVSIYVNGIHDKTATGLSTDTLGTPTNKFQFGTLWQDNNSYQFDGEIGPISIYNKALSAQEVLQNYNALKNRFRT